RKSLARRQQELRTSLPRFRQPHDGRVCPSGDRVMSDRTSGGESGEGVYGAAKEAIGSAAEQVRAAAPGTYDAGARAARYVGETASEHPFLVGTAVIAFLGGILSATVGRSSNRRGDWQEQARNW